MRISESLLRFVLVMAGLAAGPVMAFDGTRSPSDVSPAVNLDLVPRTAMTAPAVSAPALAAPVVAAPGVAMRGPEMLRALSPTEAFRAGIQALRAGDLPGGLRALEYAADHGHAIAQWKLGRMYADGDGVARNDRRAFEYFQAIADAHADDSPSTPQARFVANAFVALGGYYANGVPNSPIKADPDRAREMFSYAASYFGDADAQYHLGRMYLATAGVARDVKQAARWLMLSATKGQPQAQALLGAMLFKGDGVPRQEARGLMWLTLARDAAPQDKTIVELHAAASQQATDDQRALALTYLEGWIRGRRD